VLNDLLREIQTLIRGGFGYLDAPSLGEEVLDQIDAWVGQFLAYEERHRHTQVLWIAHCWLSDCIEYTPRLLLLSPEPGCGKTRAMTVTNHLVPRPNHTADISPAGLYYSIDHALNRRGGRPTFLYDELDAAFPTPRSNEEMRKLINAGHDRHETLTRKIGKGEKEFRLFAPMALAGMMGIFDVPETIRDRSIIIPMQRKLPGEKVVRWNRHRHPAEAAPLRWLLRYWVEFAYPYILDYVKSDHPWIPEGIEDRDADCWEPLLLAGELAGGHWVERARVAAVAGVAASGVKAVPSVGVQLLEDIKTVFENPKASRLLTETILEELKKLSPRWRFLDAQRLAKLLSSYGIKPFQQRHGKVNQRGYSGDQFEDPWARYLLPATAATAATAATPATKRNDR
jgi:hypothetical protein